MRLVRFLYITRCPHSLQRICSFCPIELEAPQSKISLGKNALKYLHRGMKSLQVAEELPPQLQHLFHLSRCR